MSIAIPEAITILAEAEQRFHLNATQQAVPDAFARRYK
jgi:hypothetical protein